MIKVKFFVVFLIFFQLNCSTNDAPSGKVDAGVGVETKVEQKDIIIGAAQLGAYLPLLVGKKVGLVVNNTTMVGEQHLVDILLEKDISIQSIFAPEHGFRGTADAGEKVADGKDTKTGLPVVSLYGKNRKPKPEQLASFGH